MLCEVVLKKDYHHERRGGSRTVYGWIDMEADSPEKAQEKVEAMMADEENRLQTCDPRITWEESYEELADRGWEYTDWTFEVVDVDEKESTLAEAVQESVTCFCPRCGKLLEKADLDGGRCTNSDPVCGTYLSAVKLTELVQWQVVSKSGTFVVHGENVMVVEKALLHHGFADFKIDPFGEA